MISVEQQELAEAIIKHCHSAESFVVHLRAVGFDAARFQQLRDEVGAYIGAIGNDRHIDRRVAGCLFFTYSQVESLVTVYRESNHPDSQRVQDAHAALWEMLERLFTLTE